MWCTRLCDDETLTKPTTHITLIDGFVEREFLRAGPHYAIHSFAHSNAHTHSHRNWQTPAHESIYFVWHFFFSPFALSLSVWACHLFPHSAIRWHRFLIHSVVFIYIRFHSLYCAMLNNRMWSINENCKLHVRFSSVFIVVVLYALVAIHFRWWCMHFFRLELMLVLLIFRYQ